MFDFTGKKVRKDGVVLDKYALGLEIVYLKGYDSGCVYHIYNDSFRYNELVDVLKSCLK